MRRYVITDSQKMKGGAHMPDKDKQIVATIEAALPNLTETQKERLLGFGDGIAAIARQQAEEKKP